MPMVRARAISTLHRWPEHEFGSKALGLAMNFELVFDADEAGYRQFPAIGLVFVALGLGLVIYHRKYPSPNWSVRSRVLPYLSTGIAVTWFSIAFVATLADYWLLRHALRSGQYEVVEGKVVDYVAMAVQPRSMDRFTVNGHRYEISYHNVSAGFNTTQSHGGPIREGLIVRIADVRGKIARLEIAR